MASRLDGDGDPHHVRSGGGLHSPSPSGQAAAARAGGTIEVVDLLDEGAASLTPSSLTQREASKTGRRSAGGGGQQAAPSPSGRGQRDRVSNSYRNTGSSYCVPLFSPAIHQLPLKTRHPPLKPFSLPQQQPTNQQNLRRRGENGVVLPTSPPLHDATTVDLTGNSDEEVPVPPPPPASASRARGGGARRAEAAGAPEDTCIILDSPPRGSGGGGGGAARAGAGAGASGSGIKCVICMDVIGVKNMASTVCGHVFCHECIAEALKTSKKCPTCRKSLRATQVHRLYV
jgi:hypothetical protein